MRSITNSIIIVAILMALSGCTFSSKNQTSRKPNESELKEAVVKDTPGAKLSLACLYYRKARYNEALPLLNQLAAKGDWKAKDVLVVMFLNGLGVEKSFEKAYLLAAEVKTAGGGGVFELPDLVKQQNHPPGGDGVFELLDFVKQQNHPPDGKYDKYILSPPGDPGESGFGLKMEKWASADGESEWRLLIAPSFTY